MSLRRTGRTLVDLVLALSLLLGVSYAQAPVTQVTETVYHADGTPAAGTLLVSWPSFTTASGASVPAGSTSVTIGVGGAMTASLVPNAGATPIGSFYTVVYHLDDGSTAREYWVVPVSAYPVQVSAIKSSVLPLSVAMQTVSKSYVDTAIATAMAGHPLDSSTPYVLKTGDTMTGPLVLPGDPASALQASDKQYVDEQTAGLTAGLAQKVSTLPPGAQTVSQPAGTALAVNDLNGVQYASQSVSSAGNDGIANATADADCANGCAVVAEPTYGGIEAVAPATWNTQTHVTDLRGGAVVDTFLNPESPHAGGVETAATVHVVSTRSSAGLKAAEGVTEPFSLGLSVQQEGLAGGSNLFPQQIQGSVPYFKTTYTATQVTGVQHTLGQHVLAGFSQTCYAVGDCLLGGQSLISSGGFRDDADEATHPFDLQFSEDTQVFDGTCASGCAAGSTSVQITPTAGAGTQGEGRYLIDTNPAKVLTGGAIAGGSNTDPLTGGIARQPSANFTGTSFPVSVLMETAQLIPTQANDVRPGTVTVQMATSGVPAGFQTNTAALPTASGVACVTDAAVADGRPLNYEMAAYTTVDGSHLSLTLNKAHASGATVAVGGLCGYGLEQTVDTLNGIRQVFPVVASTSATTLLYAGGQTAIVGVQSNTSAYLNVNAPIASVARNSNVVTVTTAGNLPVDVSGLTLTIAGVSDSSFNGSFAVTSTGPNTFTFAQSGGNATSTGGAATVVTGGYALYPMAEVLGVFNTATRAVDGQFTLAANNVAWATGDTVEQPHYFQESVLADTAFVQQFAPRPTRVGVAGIAYAGNNGPGLTGWQINNTAATSLYVGYGGTHTAPDAAYQALGVWSRTMNLEAGERAAFAVHCNAHGCGKWNSPYNLFELDSNVGVDTVQYAPTTSTLSFYLRGAQYSLSPTSLTAGTINATTINAGAITGAISAGSLPLFAASGASHAAGAVPDPGATPGASRYLREDGTWSTPPGTGSTGGTTGGSGGGISDTILTNSLVATEPSTKSLFDPDSALASSLIFASDGSVGTGFSGWTATHRFRVIPGSQFVSNTHIFGQGNWGIAYYGSDGSYISGDNTGYAPNTPVTVPAGTGIAYAALSFDTAGNMRRIWLGYGSSVPASVDEFWPLNDAGVASVVRSVDPPAVDLFDRTQILLNYLYTNLGGATLQPNSTSATTDYIPTAPGKCLYSASSFTPGNGSYGIAYFDKDKNYLTFVGGGFQSNVCNVTPFGAFYARLPLAVSSQIVGFGLLSEHITDVQLNTPAVTASVVNGSPTMTVTPPLVGAAAGQFVQGPSIPAGTTIAAVSGNVITLSANATATSTETDTLGIPATTTQGWTYDRSARPFQGLNFMTLGDSKCAGSGAGGIAYSPNGAFQDGLAAALGGSDVLPACYNGAQVQAMLSGVPAIHGGTAIVASDVANAHTAIFYGGTNNWATQESDSTYPATMPLGVLGDDCNAGTFYGALYCTLVAKLQSWNPTMQILMVTPTPRFDYQYTYTVSTTAGSSTVSTSSAIQAATLAGQPVSCPGFPANTTLTAVGSGTLTMSANATATASGVPCTIGYYNGDPMNLSGIYLHDIVNAEKTFAARWGFPIFDNFTTSGINAANWQQWMVDSETPPRNSGIHENAAYYEQIEVPRIAKWINQQR